MGLTWFAYLRAFFALAARAFFKFRIEAALCLGVCMWLISYANGRKNITVTNYESLPAYVYAL